MNAGDIFGLILFAMIWVIGYETGKGVEYCRLADGSEDGKG